MKKIFTVVTFIALILTVRAPNILAEMDAGVGIDYIFPADHRFEQGVGYTFYMKFDFNNNLSYGIMFRQLSITGEEDSNTVVLDTNEYLFSVWYELNRLLYIRAGIGGSKVIVSTGSGANDSKIISDLGLGIQKVNKKELVSKFYFELGYRFRSAGQDYFSSKNLVTDLGGIAVKLGVAIGF